jgi:hypothetical protein
MPDCHNASSLWWLIAYIDAVAMPRSALLSRRGGVVHHPVPDLHAGRPLELLVGQKRRG